MDATKNYKVAQFQVGCMSLPYPNQQKTFQELALR